MIIKIPLMCRSKKNSQEIHINCRTGKPFVSQGKLYKQFEQECGYYLLKYKKNISTPVKNYKVCKDCLNDLIQYIENRENNFKLENKRYERDYRNKWEEIY